ncbi:MAG: hypothetical protein IKK77_05775 [Clostridia bacterium]|nr:hypothetical protein [Clostridia bacterium]
MFDEDIKIAGNKPSLSVKQNSSSAIKESEIPKEIVNSAKKLGEIVALEFCKASDAYPNAVEEPDNNMIIQRLLLLSFTVTVSFDKHLKNEAVAGIAQKSFLKTVKNTSTELYKYTSDTGAFSFYYLAYRRGSEVERRMGQTFAMLCSHDGDPIYQELGEVLYCWFSSIIERTVDKIFNNK